MQANSYSKMGKLNTSIFPMVSAFLHHISQMIVLNFLCRTGYFSICSCWRDFCPNWCCFAASFTTGMPVRPVSYLLGLITSSVILFMLVVFSLLQVVEIVDRYDDACVPANVTDKLAYIRNKAIPKTCTRNLTVMGLSACILL